MDLASLNQYVHICSPPSFTATLLCLVAAALLIRFGLFIEKRRQAIARFKRCNIPLVGEPGLFGGNLLQLIARPNNCQLISDYHERLGDTYGLFYGPDPWVSTIDLELIQRVFVTEGSTHINVTQFRLPFVTEINESLAQISDDKWRTIRQIMGPSFTPKSMKSDNVFSDISDVCDMFVNMIEAHQARESAQLLERLGAGGDCESRAPAPQAASSSSAVELDVGYEFKKYALEVIFRVAFGLEHCGQLVLGARDEIIDQLDEGSHMVNSPLVRVGIMLGHYAVRLLGLLARFTPLGACIKHTHSIIDASLKQRRLVKKLSESGGGGGGGNDNDGGHFRHGARRESIKRTDRKMIDSLIERFDLGKIDDETLKANLFFILLAGHETSANTLALMFWFLANNEQCQEKLRHAIVSGGDRAEYLDWVIWETLRLYPAVPAAIGRILEHDLEHRGRRFERGVTVIASIWTLHRWQKYWGADVGLFRPERFGEPSECSPLRFFAFGDGPRYCIGKHLAMAEIRAIAVRLLVKYRVSLCASSPRRIETTSPNLIHFIIGHPIRLAFTKITYL